MAEIQTPGFVKRVMLNPLALRELRVACRHWKLVIILTSYLLVQGAIFATWVYVQSDSQGLFTDPTSIGKGLFITMAIVLVIVVMLVFPAFSSTAIASEHERKSFDLLLLTPLSPWEIALGKFFAAGIQASIFLVATVPFFAMANLFGGIDPAVFFAVLWILVLLSVFISFLGVYASSLVTRSIPAVLVTYAFAFVLGLVLLTTLTVLSIDPAYAAMAFPLIGFLLDPTLGEGLYYIVSLTVTCAIYCTFLFLSTTNRLKPTSHNKSTGLRIFWTCVAVIVPLQIVTYFLMTRLPAYTTAFNTLIIGTIYAMLLMLVPALTGPAEPPVPSRRVRREFEKMSSALRVGGGVLFPGSARGALHSAILVVLITALMAIVAFVAFHEVGSRHDDLAALQTDFEAVTGTAGAGAMASSMVTGLVQSDPAEVRGLVATFLDHDFTGYLGMLTVLALVVLVAGQITWRLSLSGLTKALSSVLATLILALWVAVPYIAQFAGGESRPEEQKVAQFSPVHAAAIAIVWGRESARAEVIPGPQAEQHAERANSMSWRWWTFTGSALLLGLGLLGANLLGHMRVKRLVAQARLAAEARHEQPAPQVSPEALQQALETVAPDGLPPPAP